MSQLLGRHCINQTKRKETVSDFEELTENFGVSKLTPPSLLKVQVVIFLFYYFFSLLATTIKLLERTFTGALDVSRPNGRMEHDEIDTG